MEFWGRRYRSLCLSDHVFLYRSMGAACTGHIGPVIKYVCTTSVVLLPRIRDPWHDQIDHPRVRMDLQCGTLISCAHVKLVLPPNGEISPNCPPRVPLRHHRKLTLMTANAGHATTPWRNKITDKITETHSQSRQYP
jgi:hypothetical protein